MLPGSFLGIRYGQQPMKNCYVAANYCGPIARVEACGNCCLRWDAGAATLQELPPDYGTGPSTAPASGTEKKNDFPKQMCKRTLKGSSFSTC